MAGISEIAQIAAGRGYDQSINFRVEIDRNFKVPDEFYNPYIIKEGTNPSIPQPVDDDDNRKLEGSMVGTKVDPAFGVKTYSDIVVTDQDIDQYQNWKYDEKNTPQLASKFKTYGDYSKFMEDYIDTHLTIDKDPAVMSKTFSIANDEQYGFSLETESWQGDEQGLDFDHVIGSVLFSITFAHIFHLCTTDYPAHIALNDYYDEMPDKIDALAEKFLSDNSSIMIINAILPGLDPVDYFERLKKFVATFANGMQGVYVDTSAYQSELDDIINLISSTLYKLKRLATPKVNTII